MASFRYIPRLGELLIGFGLLLAVGAAFLLHTPNTPEPPPPQAEAQVASVPLKIVVFGDSLVAGYKIPKEMAFPARLEAALKEAGHTVTVMNAGISGDTTAGGLTRLSAILEQKPHIVILELGANDMLRGTAPETMRDNLDTMLKTMASHSVYVLFTGMRLPQIAAHGQDYSGIYDALAEKHNVTYFPFFLEGVAQNSTLNLPGDYHPNEAGVDVMVKNILPVVQSMIAQLRKSPAS